MDILACLVQELWQNNQKLFRESPLTARELLKSLGTLAITFSPETRGIQSRAGKDSFCSLESKQTQSLNQPIVWAITLKRNTYKAKYTKNRKFKRLIFSLNYKTSRVF